MDEEYVVLRFEGLVPRIAGGLQSMDGQAATAEAAAGRNVSVFAATLSEEQRQKEAEDPKQLVSLTMPTALVAPLDAADAGVTEQGDPVEEARTNKRAWGIEAVGLPAADYPYTGRGVVVAVLDTGIDTSHAAFQGITFDAANVKNFSTSGDGDKNGHGTHCASTIFGQDVDGVRIGIAPNVTKVLIGKVLNDAGRGSTLSVIEALKWAHSQGANVISMSLGFDFPALQERLENSGLEKKLATSRALRAYRENLRAFDALVAFLRQDSMERPGAVLVAASGNESRRWQGPRHVIDVAMPAATDQVVSVGALMRKDGKLAVAPFSNINPIVSAPGYGVVGAKSGGGLAALNGTSMACPHVAGLAALWWEREVRETGFAAAATTRASLIAMASRVPGIDRVDQGIGMARAPAAPS